MESQNKQNSTGRTVSSFISGSAPVDRVSFYGKKTTADPMQNTRQKMAQEMAANDSEIGGSVTEENANNYFG
jgi:hypothetical protein